MRRTRSVLVLASVMLCLCVLGGPAVGAAKGKEIDPFTDNLLVDGELRFATPSNKDQPRKMHLRTPRYWQLNTGTKTLKGHDLPFDKDVKCVGDCSIRMDGKGGKLAKKEIEQALGFPIHYYVKVDFAGFVKMINLLEGIDLCVDQAIHDSQHDTHINIGCQHMDGEDGLAYVRSRYTTSDFDRSRRQQKVLMAIKDKALKLNFLLNPLKINQALNILVGHFNTDIKLSELKDFSSLVRELNSQKITNYVLDNRKDNLIYSTIKDGAYVLIPYGGDFEKIHKFAKKKIP